MEKTPGKENADEQDQAGTENAAQPVGELFRMQRHQKSGSEKQEGITQLQTGRAADQRCQHGKRCTGGAGDGQAGADGQIDQNGEHKGKGRMHPAGQRFQSAGPCHSDNARDGQADGADGKPGESGPQM